MRCLATLSIVLMSVVVPTAVAHAEATVVRASAMLDVRTGKMVKPAVVVVEKGRIQAVNPKRVPEKAQLIDLGDRTLLPGLIDTHVHLTLDNTRKDWIHREVKVLPGQWALVGAQSARRTLMAGFTTVRDVGSWHLSNIALERSIEEGVIIGPRIIPSGGFISITGGHADATGYAPGVLEIDFREGVVDGVDGVLKTVRYQIKHGAKVIKMSATAGIMSFEATPGAQQMSEEEMRTAVEEARRHGVRVAAHAHGAEGIKAALRAGVDSIEHGSLIDKEGIRLMKKRGAYLVPTASFFRYKTRIELPPHIKKKWEEIERVYYGNMRVAFQSGVKVAFGTDAGVFPHGENAREFGEMVDLGMKPLEAIRAATVNAADLLGTNDRGAIAPGLLADLIAVKGNPLENFRVLERVDFVMKDGVVYKQNGVPRCTD